MVPWLLFLYENSIGHHYLLHVKHCEVCQRSKRKFDRPAAALHPISVSDTWKKLGIDLIELPLTLRGNRYCITLTDYFSKRAEAQAIPTKEASNVATFLHKMFLRHGCPQEIISDQVCIRSLVLYLMPLLHTITIYLILLCYIYVIVVVIFNYFTINGFMVLLLFLWY